MSRMYALVFAALLARASFAIEAQEPANPPQPGTQQIQSPDKSKAPQADPAQDMPPTSYEPSFSTMQAGLPPAGCRGNFVVGGKGIFYQGPRGSLTLPALGIEKGFVLEVEYELKAGPNDCFVVTMQPKGFRGDVSIGIDPGGTIYLNGKKAARGKVKRGVNQLYLERLHGPQGISFVVGLNGEQVGVMPIKGDPVPTVTLGAVSTGRTMWVGVSKLSVRWQK